MSGAATPHVPAWRKLGLKLKYAKDIPEQQQQRQQSFKSNPNLEPVSSKSVNGAKRRKLASPEPETKAPEKAVQTNGGQANGRLATSKKALSTRNRKVATPPPPSPATAQERHRKNKSVSFTPDTKTEDGTSTRELLDSWRESEGVDANESSSKQPALEVAEQAVSEGKKKPKRPKRSKSTLLENQKATSDKTDSSSSKVSESQPITEHSPVLEYLSTFHKSHDTWKFNKARQNQLFKKILDVGKIPPSYDAALLAYLDGLQGQAKRNQLREEALQIREQDAKDGLDKDDGTMSPKYEDKRNQAERVSTDEERHEAAYRNALRRFKTQAKWDAILDEEEDLQMSVEWERRLAARQRAEKMLQKLGDKKKSLAETINTPQRQKTGVDFEVQRVVEPKTKTKTTTPLDQNGLTRKRKRKRRTAVPDDDSSSDETSSSSDSDSDSASDEDDEGDRILAKRLKTAINGRAPKLNDSSSDSDSSDDDSDSDSSDDDSSSSDSD